MRLEGLGMDQLVANMCYMCNPPVQVCDRPYSWLFLKECTYTPTKNATDQ